MLLDTVVAVIGEPAVVVIEDPAVVVNGEPVVVMIGAPIVVVGVAVKLDTDKPVFVHLGLQRKAKAIKHIMHLKNSERTHTLPLRRRNKIVYANANKVKNIRSTQRILQNVSGSGHNPHTLCSAKHEIMDANMHVK